MTIIAVATLAQVGAAIGDSGAAALADVSVFGMLVGFVFWYRGLTPGGIAGIGQSQLPQFFFRWALAVLLPGGPVDGTMIGASGVVVRCVASARHFA